MSLPDNGCLFFLFLVTSTPHTRQRLTGALMAVESHLRSLFSIFCATIIIRARVRTNITRLAARKCAAERALRKIIKSAIIAFQQNNSLYAYARSPDPLSRSD